MNRPDGTPDDDAMREVQGAYRELPGVEPGADLDARVRAAVAAEVAAESTTTRGRHPKVVPLARWRRVALPFAAAAAVLVAVGVDRYQSETASRVQGISEASRRPERAQGMDLVRPRSALPAPLGASAPPPPPPEPPASKARQVNTPMLDLPVVMGPPPAAQILRAVEPAMLEAQRQQAREATTGLAAGAASDAAPALAKPAAPAANPPLAIVPAPKPAPNPASTPAPTQTADDAAAFADMRQLLAQNRRDEALARLKRWREANPDAPLPTDLRELETDSHR